MIEQLLIYIQQYICNFADSPILIHCSAGTGRTGSLIAIYNIIKSFSVIKIFNSNMGTKIKPFFSVFNVVRKLREQRYAMVSSFEQYRFIYDFSIEWLRRNFDFNLCTTL